MEKSTLAIVKTVLALINLFEISLLEDKICDIGRESSTVSVDLYTDYAVDAEKAEPVLQELSSHYFIANITFVTFFEKIIGVYSIIHGRAQSGCRNGTNHWIILIHCKKVEQLDLDLLTDHGCVGCFCYEEPVRVSHDVHTLVTCHARKPLIQLVTRTLLDHSHYRILLVGSYDVEHMVGVHDNVGSDPSYIYSYLSCEALLSHETPVNLSGNPHPTVPSHMTVVVDCQSTNTTLIMVKVLGSVFHSKGILDRPVLTWVIVGSSDLLSGDLTSVLKRSDFLVHVQLTDCNNTAISAMTPWDRCVVSTVYQAFTNESRLTEVSKSITLLGSPGEQHMSNLPPAAFQGFNLDTVHIGYVRYKPFVYQDGETMEGIAAEYLYLLAEAYNFSIVFVENEAGLYGSVDENDTWNGLIAMMLQGDIDMTGTALSITEARQRAVEFTAPFFMDSPALGVGAQDLGIFHFLRPFTLEVWLYYISSVVVTIIFVLWLSCIQRHLTGNGVTKHGTSSIADTVTYTVGTAVNQSSGLHLRTWSIRVVSLLSWLMFSLLSMSYSGHLVASLTTTQVYIPFNNLEEMVAQDEYKLVFEHGTLYHDMFRDATDPVFREGWAKAEKDIKLEGDYVEHVITSGKYVIINDRVDLVFRSRQRPQCDFFVLPDNLGPIGSGFALPSGSPFKDMFSNVILDAQAGGLDHSWFKKYWPDDWCSAKLKISAQAQAVGLHSLLGLFLLVIGGVAIASLTFIIEYFTVKPRRKL